VNRWLVLLAALAALLWWWQHRELPPEPAKPAIATSEPAKRVPDRPGGGLNPFVMDTDIDAPPQRPRAP
jgi:hypothetical protein